MAFKAFVALFIVLAFYAIISLRKYQSHERFLFKSGDKVHLYLTEVKDIDLSLLERISYNLFSYPNFIIPKGTQLSYLIKRECLTGNQNQMPTYIDSEQEPMTIKNLKNYATSKSIKVVLQKDTPINNLKDSAENNTCIVGVSHNQMANSTSDLDFQLNQIKSFNRTLNLLGQILLPNFDLKPIIVAIIDTGIDYNHKSLRQYIWTNSLELNGLPNYDDDGNGFEDDIYGYNFPDRLGDPSHKTVNDHGTHVAGLVLSSYFFLNREKFNIRPIKLMTLNVYGKNWGAETVDIDNAIKYAVDNGANIINISLGGPGHSDTTAQAIDYAINKGVTVVSSVGNLETNIDGTFYFPASYAHYFSGMISVGAHDIKLNTLCGFSNYGVRSVEIAAPGCDNDAPKKGIYSTRSKNRFGYKKGTSQAAPFISGLAAYLNSQVANGILSPLETEKEVLTYSTTSSDLEGFIEDGRHFNFTEPKEPAF